ncbi:hypothetical protein [Clostridium sp. CF012]|uniref:hypothetical protein n=1 Tax=Clostridium sp. CF012 TaxID=2843319 RepID=UPI001C0BE8C4|nr:hypothetical protein [Clostridium sp. CF012]MBU3146753.1 hypothetical protein [Clostridium sp. CF012]
MFRTARFYIIVAHKNLIIKKEGENSETIIDFASVIPNVPFYYHFFDEDKTYIKDMTSLIKKLNIRNAIIIVPDDSVDIEVDRKVFTEFFLKCGVKKIQTKSQCFLLSLDNKKYISVSRTARTIVLQYIVNNKSIVKKYLDKNYTDMKQIALDVKNIHPDCEYESIPIYINNMNNDMEKFKVIGPLVSLNNIITNITNYKMDN